MKLKSTGSLQETFALFSERASTGSHRITVAEKSPFRRAFPGPVKLLLILGIGVMLLFTPSSLLAVKKHLTPAVAESLAAATDDPLVAADAYSDAWMHKKALETLKEVKNDDAEVRWRIARSLVDVGENLEGDNAYFYFKLAQTEAETAVAMAPDNAMAQQTLATATGRVALYKGIFKASRLVKQVRKHALKAVALGDSMPVALYILGKTHKKLMEKSALARRLGGLSWARDDSVIYYFDRALAVSGGNMIQCRTEYAEFLLEKGDREGAREMLVEALALPLRDEQDQKAKVKAGKLMEKLKANQ